MKNRTMDKLKLFIENFLIYGFGGIISKLVPLLMVPIVTRLMPNSEYYGISDLSNTVIQFGSALAVCGMYDAMYRMFFERDDEEFKKKICSTTLIFTLISSIMVFLVMLILGSSIAEYFFSDRKYTNVAFLSAAATLVGSTNQIISAPTRMQNKRKIFLIANTVSPLISYGISISMLMRGYYIIALPLAAVISGIIIEIIFGIINREWFCIKSFDLKLLKQLLVIAIPLLPNFLIYWIFNSCDRIMITNMIGIGEAGIYSVGSKLGHCSQLIYIAFSGGWQYFAFSTMKENNQVKSNSMVFEYLGILSFAATSFVCAWSYWIFKLLFTEQYFNGYIVAPYLFFAPLLQMLFQVAANQFLVIKKTWPNILILSTGAVINIVINYTLIPIIGIEGAALATLLGYVISDSICVIILYKLNLMTIRSEFLWAIIVIVVYLFCWRLFFYNNIVFGTLMAITVSTVFVFLYRLDLKKLFLLLKK